MKVILIKIGNQKNNNSLIMVIVIKIVREKKYLLSDEGFGCQLYEDLSKKHGIHVDSY